MKEPFKYRDLSIPAFSFKANLTPDKIKALQTMNTEPEKMKITIYEVKDDDTIVGPIAGEMLKRDWDKLQGMAEEENDL